MLDKETSFFAMWARGDFEFCKKCFDISLASVDLATHGRSFRSVLKSPSQGKRFAIGNLQSGGNCLKKGRGSGGVRCLEEMGGLQRRDAGWPN